MDAGTSTIIGAAVGALSGLFGALGSQWWTARRDNTTWVRDKKEEAYGKTISSCLRIRYRKSKLSIDSGPYLAEEDITKWFDDIVDFLSWLTLLQIYCSPNFKTKIGKDIRKITAITDNFIGNVLLGTDENVQLTVINPIDEDTIKQFMVTIEEVYDSVVKCAQLDLKVPI